jgi:hypothetical protein
MYRLTDAFQRVNFYLWPISRNSKKELLTLILLKIFMYTVCSRTCILNLTCWYNKPCVPKIVEGSSIHPLFPYIWSSTRWLNVRVHVHFTALTGNCYDIKMRGQKSRTNVEPKINLFLKITSILKGFSANWRESEVIRSARWYWSGPKYADLKKNSK